MTQNHFWWCQVFFSNTHHLIKNLLVSIWQWFLQGSSVLLHTHWKLIERFPRLDVSRQCPTIIKATGKGNRSQVFCLLEPELQQWLDAGMTVKYQWLYGYSNCHSDRSHVLFCCLEGIKEIKADMKTFFSIWQHFFLQTTFQDRRSQCEKHLFDSSYHQLICLLSLWGIKWKTPVTGRLRVIFCSIKGRNFRVKSLW